VKVPPVTEEMSFESFVVGRSNMLAARVAERICAAPGSDLNPLVVCGGVGNGKTHLLMAIARRLKERDPDCSVVFTTAEKFATQFTAGIRSHDGESFRARYRRADALAIDDIHLVSSKAKTQIELMRTFEELLNAGRQIVVSSLETPKRLGSLHPGLVGQLVAGLVVVLQAPDEEVGRRVLEDRMRRQGVSWAPEVSEFLARNVTRSVRDLCAAVTRLKAHVALGETVDIPLVRCALADLLGPGPSLAPESLLLEIVARRFGIGLSDLGGPSRRRELTGARQVAMYLLRKHTGLSLAEIGRLFHRRPSAVSFARAKIEESIKADDALREVLQDCERRFEGRAA